MRPLIELAIYGGALLAVGDPTHFTWWGVASLCMANVAEVLPDNCRLFRTRTSMLAAVVCTVIMGAVVVMSLAQCHMLTDTLQDMGPWAYGAGNFALHYYPSLRSLTLAYQYDTHHTTGDAARYLAAYCVLHQPNAVYGCGLPHAWLIAPIGILIMGASEYGGTKLCNIKLK